MRFFPTLRGGLLGLAALVVVLAPVAATAANAPASTDAALDDAPDLPVTTQRLLQNQTDIGNAVRPFYGDAAALNTHMARWQANADAIADFPGAANPEHWSATSMRAIVAQFPTAFDVAEA